MIKATRRRGTKDTERPQLLEDAESAQCECYAAQIHILSATIAAEERRGAILGSFCFDQERNEPDV